ncbi:srg family chemoreceptor domain-containing protein [Ditylenchus destructor]|uniref:Serpentine receptor class gamma n=1 Tax=Ditylenchus destructor TaxID=166010 RepID=A0AAD4N022_9BILA|nr:srg family chemoreceptor domain-containing protein [Ditylenchus destructor]
MEIAVLLTYRKHFDSSFFRLFLLRSIPNVLNYFSSYAGIRFGRLGFFLDFYLTLPRIVLAFLFFENYYSFHAENLATTFLLLNRFATS